MKITDPIDAKVSTIEAELARENQLIETAMAAKQIGDGYWKRRWQIENQLAVAKALQSAVREVLG
jgi:hypothetical protein